jgi:hypothetical protein
VSGQDRGTEYDRLEARHPRQGTGQITAVPFRTPESSLDFWIDRLAAQGVDFDGPERRTVIEARLPALRLPARVGRPPQEGA